jgi:hypothetical protein
MSMLVHRCRKCHHVENWHGKEDCSYGACRCSKSTADVDPTPELIPTFDGRTSAPILTVTKPGDGWNKGLQRQDTCSCEMCLKAYDGLVSA